MIQQTSQSNVLNSLSTCNFIPYNQETDKDKNSPDHTKSEDNLDPKSKEQPETPEAPDISEGKPRKTWLKKLLILSLGINAIIATYLSRERIPSPEKQDKFNTNQVGLMISSDPSENFSHLPSIESALKGIKEGKYEGAVFEYENRNSGSFTYAFNRKNPMGTDTQGFKNFEILHGIPNDSRRTEFLANISQAGLGYDSTILPDPKVKPNYLSILLLNAPHILIIGLFLYYFGKIKNAFSGRLGSELSGVNPHPEQVKTSCRLSDIKGSDSAVSSARELLTKIRSRMQGNQFIELPSARLIEGPPGTGKTLLARAIAGEASCPVHAVNGTAITSGSFMGQWVTEVLNMFQKARDMRDEQTLILRSKPGATGNEQGVVFIVIDEIEQIGKKRSEGSPHGSSDEANQVINAFLQELDGIEEGKNHDIIVLGITNYKSRMDEALIRDGRFGTEPIVMNPPISASGRFEILKVRCKDRIENRGKIIIEEDHNLKKLSELTPGFTGAQLKGILNSAWDIANFRESAEISAEDLFEAFQRENSGRTIKMNLSEDMRSRINGHELGHMLMALAHGINPYIYSNICRERSFARYVPDPEFMEEGPLVLSQAIARLSMFAGGIAAETFMFPEHGPSDGASGDLEKMRNLVMHMLSNGLTGTTFSTNLQNLPEHLIPEKYQSEIDRIVQKIIAHSRKTFDTMGEKVFARHLQITANQELELVGDQTRELLERIITPEELKILQQAGREIRTEFTAVFRKEAV